tara:strand:- start:3300 stop:4481 length:1182 start_codon:yes stop_codon:yes gene_type:complete
MPVATKTQSVTNTKLALATAALLAASGLALITIPFGLSRGAGCGNHTCVPKKTKIGMCVDNVSAMAYQCSGSKQWNTIQDGCGKTLTSLQREVVNRCGKRLGVKSMIGQKDGECTVTFPDQNLHNAVCGLFGNEDDCEISCEEPGFSYTNSIYFNNREIEDITGIERLVNIRTLLLNNNSINNISSISNLNSLNNLMLSNNQISNISSISNLNNLTNLNLSDNQIIDITPVSNLTNLRHLYLSNNTGILDFQPIAQLPALTLLFVSGIPSAYSPENCQVLNGLIERRVEVNDFDPDQCEEVVAEVCEPLVSEFACSPTYANRPFNTWDFSNATTTAFGYGIEIQQDGECSILYQDIPTCSCMATASSTIRQQNALFSGAYLDENGIYHSPCIY